MSDHVTTRPGAEPGTAAWVRERLDAISDRDDWAEHPACAELIGWLYLIIKRRAGTMNLPSHARADIVQDAMTPIVSALQTSRRRIAQADNPAAVLARVAVRAVAGAGHSHRMAGYSGVAANGQNWHAEYPRRVAGDAPTPILEATSAPVDQPSPAVERAASRVAEWVFEQVGVTLSPDAVDATVYVIDRLLAGVGRTALVRGGHSGLRGDRAMRHLGFDPSAASAFGCWLLGRHDAKHNAPSVLDAALRLESPHPVIDPRWRRQAVTFGFATDTRLSVPQPVTDRAADTPARLTLADPPRFQHDPAPPHRTNTGDTHSPSGTRDLGGCSDHRPHRLAAAQTPGSPP